MNIENLLEGGYAKKPYLPIGKQFVCGKERVIYKRNVNNDSSKVYMRHNAKYIQVVNFEKEMIAKGKWKLPTPVKQSKDVKPCKTDQYRNPATGRCVKIKPDKGSAKPDNGSTKPAKPVKPAKPAKPVKPAKTIKSPISLIGKYVVLADDITGSKYFILKDLIHAKGGEAHTLNYVNDNVWEKMNIFIAKDIKANTEKLKKAKQFNLTIIKYDTFMKLYATPAKTDVKPQNNTISMVVIGMLMNKNVTFTGIRDKNLEAVIEANCGKVFSTVSKKVDLLIAKDINANSASIIKAKQLNIDIIQYDKLMQY